MKISWIKLLGFLGFLGLLGIFTSNIGFFSFFSYRKMLNDERMELNVNRAGRNAFIVSILVFVVSTLIVALTEDLPAFTYAFIIAIVLQIIVFSLSLRLYEK